MKQSDIALVIFMSAVAVVASFFAFNAILGDPDEKVESVKTATLISDVARPPDPLVFNSDAIDPTVTVCIGTEDPEDGSVDECGNKIEESKNKQSATNAEEKVE
ncbi:MAG: hypothetical protein LBQ02_03755 [Candidatus Nomurabacteria bacterium]|jgi:hypothetical protein|nr:hypothetical protein [Candidatus Nomurabacteria bacterium]